jgi:hypothetical protein
MSLPGTAKIHGIVANTGRIGTRTGRKTKKEKASGLPKCGRPFARLGASSKLQGVVVETVVRLTP